MGKTIKIAGQTNVGSKRTANQDDLFFLSSKTSSLAVTGVADGMGGHAGGEIASALCLNVFKNTLGQTVKTKSFRKNPDIKEAMKYSAIESNKSVRSKAQKDANLTGMGTTLVAATMNDKEFTIINIGDSRGYLIRNGKIRQITKDHSWVAEQLEAGLIDEKTAEQHPQRNIITRAIGISDDVEVDIFQENVQPNDMVLLCSDGLYPLVSEVEIIEKCNYSNLDNSCLELISLANQRGGPDNITLVIARI